MDEPNIISEFSVGPRVGKLGLRPAYLEIKGRYYSLVILSGSSRDKDDAMDLATAGTQAMDDVLTIQMAMKLLKETDE